MCLGNEEGALQHSYVLIPEYAAPYAAVRNNAACVHLCPFLSDHSTQPDSHWQLFPYTVIHSKRVALWGFGIKTDTCHVPCTAVPLHLAAIDSPLAPCHKNSGKSGTGGKKSSILMEE